jgi:hypothetical protein
MTGLSKKKVGEYLGDPKNEKVLAAFLEGFDFVGKGFDDALREFLSKFRLPGEAQVCSHYIINSLKLFFLQFTLLLSINQTHFDHC